MEDGIEVIFNLPYLNIPITNVVSINLGIIYGLIYFLKKILG